MPRSLYPNSVTWRSSTWQLAAVLGPALGGLIYGFGTATAAYVVDVTLMVAALVAIARIDHVHDGRSLVRHAEAEGVERADAPRPGRP